MHLRCPRLVSRDLGADRFAAAATSAAIVSRARADQFDLAAGDGGGDGIGAGLDAVGHHGMLGAVQRCRRLRPRSRDVPRPEIFAPIAIRQWPRSSISGSRAALPMHGLALGQRRRHQRGFGGADRDEGKLDTRALQPARRAGDDIAVFEFDLRAHRLQRLQMQIDRPRADGAAAGQRHLGLAMRAPAAAPAPGSSRASCARCRRRRTMPVMRRGGEAIASPSPRPEPGVHSTATPKLAQQIGHDGTSARRGTLVSVSGSSVRRRRRHQLQRRILGAADRDFALQARAAANSNPVHETLRNPRCRNRCNARTRANTAMRQGEFIRRFRLYSGAVRALWWYAAHRPVSTATASRALRRFRFSRSARARRSSRSEEFTFMPLCPSGSGGL